MLRKLTVGLLLLALAGATMGQESCSTEPGGDQTSAGETDAADREAARERKRERRAEKRRAKKRRERERRRREQRLNPDPAPERPAEPEPEPDGGSSNCHPSYKGDCLDPSASDYDCAGGSGDGPKYANGPIRVVGSDDYDLDRDGDGTACET